jgi:hypothetical protein
MYYAYPAASELPLTGRMACSVSRCTCSTGVCVDGEENEEGVDDALIAAGLLWLDQWRQWLRWNVRYVS